MEKKNQNLMPRAPIVVVLGHIDHGKTKLLDTIRKTNVVEEESGGITQHIGAYEIEYKGKKITFLDTPGHEAFSKMRSRGARVADIAILVVAADEGVKPQTEESVKIIQEAKVPFIVAINKIDKPEAQPEKVKQQLANLGVLVEGWGGNVPVCAISAKFNKGIDELLDMIQLVAEMENLEGDLSKPAKGVVIESRLDSQRGFVATLLLEDGKLSRGDYLIIGGEISKVRMMEDFIGKKINSATFSSPVLITGFEKMAQVGEEFQSAKEKKEAEDIAASQKGGAKVMVEDRSERLMGKKILSIVLKTDVFGSKEVLEKMINDLIFQEVAANLLKSEIGDVNESDIKFAQSSKSIIVAFRTRVPAKIELLAKNSNIKIITSDIIYDLIDKVKLELKNLLAAEIIRYDIGKLNVLAIFKMEKNKAIIGGRVMSGEIQKGVVADVMRGDKKIISGKISQLQQNKQDVESVKQGECGILFSFSEKDLLVPGPIVKVGDMLQIYREEKKEKELI